MTIRDPSPAPPTVQPPTVQPPTAGPAAPRPVCSSDLHVADEAVAVREALALTLPSDGGRVAALLTAGPGVRAEALRQRLRAALSAGVCLPPLCFACTAVLPLPLLRTLTLSACC